MTWLNLAVCIWKQWASKG